MEEIQELNDSLQMIPLDKRNELARQIREVKQKLVDEVDYGQFRGNKPSLMKPGAEKFIRAFNLSTNIETKVTILADGNRDFISTCTLTYNSGNVLCRADGFCTTMESNYIKNPAGNSNTCLKMAGKRAMIASVLIGLGLSGLFTQDTEDMPKQSNNYKSNDKPNTSNGNGQTYDNLECPACKEVKLGKDKYPKNGEDGLFCFNCTHKITVRAYKALNKGNENHVSPKDQSLGPQEPTNSDDWEDSDQPPDY